LFKAGIDRKSNVSRLFVAGNLAARMRRSTSRRSRSISGQASHWLPFRAPRSSKTPPLQWPTFSPTVTAIQGHGENGVSGEYGTGYYVETLNVAIQKVEYKGLDLSHLMRGRPRPTLHSTLSRS
jgi:hypothetical protein